MNQQHTGSDSTDRLLVQLLGRTVSTTSSVVDDINKKMDIVINVLSELKAKMVQTDKETMHYVMSPLLNGDKLGKTSIDKDRIKKEKKEKINNQRKIFNDRTGKDINKLRLPYNSYLAYMTEKKARPTEWYDHCDKIKVKYAQILRDIDFTDNKNKNTPGKRDIQYWAFNEAVYGETGALEFEYSQKDSTKKKKRTVSWYYSTQWSKFKADKLAIDAKPASTRTDKDRTTLREYERYGQIAEINKKEKNRIFMKFKQDFPDDYAKCGDLLKRHSITLEDDKQPQTITSARRAPIKTTKHEPSPNDGFRTQYNNMESSGDNLNKIYGGVYDN